MIDFDDNDISRLPWASTPDAEFISWDDELHPHCPGEYYSAVCGGFYGRAQSAQEALERAHRNRSLNMRHVR